jgi:hypothetical protein
MGDDEPVGRRHRGEPARSHAGRPRLRVGFERLPSPQERVAAQRNQRTWPLLSARDWKRHPDHR